jgi:hypothetical protein
LQKALAVEMINAIGLILATDEDWIGTADALALH